MTKFDNVPNIPAPKSMRCEICNDDKRDIIFDHYNGDDIDICVNCYVNKYGVQDLLKHYGKNIVWGKHND